MLMKDSKEEPKDFEKSKFRFSETFNNANGKTSGSGFIGVIFGIVTAVAFFVLTISFALGFGGNDLVDIIKHTLSLGGISAMLLGARKVAGAFKKDEA
jgi:hypothetical protein